MLIKPRTIRLKDGRKCLLRSPGPEDALGMIRHLRRIMDETEFVSGYSDEFTYTEDDEINLIHALTASVYSLCILAFVDDRLAGICMVRGKSERRKIRHRADLGISVIKDCWHAGVGSALMETALDEAKQLELDQIELAVYEGNTRAKALYERMGFVSVGFVPNAAKLRDGSRVGEYIMVYAITR